jgi:hypothetical protein
MSALRFMLVLFFTFVCGVSAVCAFCALMAGISGHTTFYVHIVFWAGMYMASAHARDWVRTHIR